MPVWDRARRARRMPLRRPRPHGRPPLPRRRSPECTKTVQNLGENKDSTEPQRQGRHCRGGLDGRDAIERHCGADWSKWHGPVVHPQVLDGRFGKLTTYVPRAIGRAKEGQGLCPWTPPRGSAPWIPAKGTALGTLPLVGAREGGLRRHRHSGAIAPECRWRRRPPSLAPTKTDGVQRLRLWWGSRGQSPLAGFRAEP
jgi:hypothetical protein